MILQKMAIVVEEREDVELDLSGDLSTLKENVVVLKQGRPTSYRIDIYFYVQREIVAGLTYFQVITRKGIRVDEVRDIVGSYRPKMEPHSFLTTETEAAAGMFGRGSALSSQG